MPLPLSKDEERELLAVLRDDRIARDTLIERNMRLVPMMIHRYFRNTTWEEEDLFGIGIIGLVKAIDSYKVGSGISLSTYATTCIRNEILKSLRKEKHRRLQIDALIAEDERYGKIVCRCENVSEREIIDAINRPIRPQTMDGIKRRVRAGMGRCQGGFCSDKVARILAKENKVALESIVKERKGGYYIAGDLRKGGK